MDISVCIGSSCHLRGSYEIIENFKRAIEENHLSDVVSLKAAFCLGKCTTGVSIKIDNEIITGVSNDNFNEIFSTYVLGAIK